jgi:hypothetical protein
MASAQDVITARRGAAAVDAPGLPPRRPPVAALRPRSQGHQLCPEGAQQRPHLPLQTPEAPLASLPSALGPSPSAAGPAPPSALAPAPAHPLRPPLAPAPAPPVLAPALPRPLRSAGAPALPRPLRSAGTPALPRPFRPFAAPASTRPFGPFALRAPAVRGEHRVRRVVRFVRRRIRRLGLLAARLVHHRNGVRCAVLAVLRRGPRAGDHRNRADHERCHGEQRASLEVHHAPPLSKAWARAAGARFRGILGARSAERIRE